MLTFDPTVVVSTTGDSPLTVTASLSVPTFIGDVDGGRLSLADETSSRMTVLNP